MGTKNGYCKVYKIESFQIYFKGNYIEKYKSISGINSYQYNWISWN